ncbi:MAG: hypothetical protein IPL83_03945 [Bdellovibrionales bacterium]|nr:hypothetical protein [Bdellovibrionales bacterium]
MTVGSSEIRLLIRRPSDINTAAGLQAFGDSVMSKRHRELAELNLRGSGSSSAWCSAHKGSAAAGRMFEDPGLLRFGSARDSLEFGTTIKQASLSSVSQPSGGEPLISVSAERSFR